LIVVWELRMRTPVRPEPQASSLERSDSPKGKPPKAAL